MTCNPVGLVEFLRARYGEEETAWSGGLDLATRPEFAKLAQHQLADIAAKRRIIEAYVDARSRRDILQSDEARAVEDERQRERRRAEAARCRGLEIALEALAAPFSSHLDWQPEWSTG